MIAFPHFSANAIARLSQHAAQTLDLTLHWEVAASLFELNVFAEISLANQFQEQTEEIFMGNASNDQLKRVIETRLGGVASFVRSMRVAPAGQESSDWDGVVHLFDLKNHPQAKRAYA